MHGDTSDGMHNTSRSLTICVVPARKEKVTQISTNQYQRVNTPGLSECCQAVNKLSTSCQEKKYLLPKHIFSSQQTKILRVTFTQKIPKIETDEVLRVAVRWLSRGCQEAVGWLSGKNHHNFEAKIKFGRWFRYHRRAYSTSSVLTPAKFDLRFRLSRGCSPSAPTMAPTLVYRQ